MKTNTKKSINTLLVLFIFHISNVTKIPPKAKKEIPIIFISLMVNKIPKCYKLVPRYMDGYPNLPARKKMAANHTLFYHFSKII